jgi:hypothetical protein
MFLISRFSRILNNLCVFKVLSVTLSISQGEAQLNPGRSQANVTINLNDDAHGVIEFSQNSYTVHENDQNTTAHIPIVRKRGTYGDAKVYYRYAYYISKILSFNNMIQCYYRRDRRELRLN